MIKSVALILAKGQSNRLPNKNKLPFRGEPMFLENLKKCLLVFDEVYVSSDDQDILDKALDHGGIPIKRGEELCGDTPNIPVYQHAQEEMDADIIVAVQANSPTIKVGLIARAKIIMETGVSELITINPDRSIYGSIWALDRKRLANYDDPYNPQPEVLLVDDSIDIHTKEDYYKACQ